MRIGEHPRERSRLPKRVRERRTPTRAGDARAGGEPAKFERLEVEFPPNGERVRKEHLEAAVEPKAVALSGPDPAADGLGPFEQRHLEARAGEVARGDEAGEPAPTTTVVSRA